MRDCNCPEYGGMIYHQQATCTDPVAARLGWYAPDPDNSPAMCEAHPDDCPLGPGPHPFVSPDQTEGLCCCRQPWEEVESGG
jgi:hypothetical protein